MKIAGKNISNWWLVGGGLGVVAAVYFYRKAASGSSGSGSAASSPDATDPVTGLPYSEDNQADPATGLTYLQEAQEYGSVEAAEEAVTSGEAYFGQTGTGGAVDSGFPTIYPSQVTPTGPGNYSTNAAWAQAVTAGLAQLGYAATDIAAALGLFFAQQPLGSGSDGVSYASIIQAAEAEYGPPPQGTYAIIPAPSTTGPTTGSGGGGTTATRPSAAPAGLSVFMVSDTEITASWKPVARATGYDFQVTPKDSAPHNIGARTSYNVGGLKARTSYVVHVAAVNSAGTGPYATHSLTTK